MIENRIEGVDAIGIFCAAAVRQEFRIVRDKLEERTIRNWDAQEQVQLWVDFENKRASFIPRKKFVQVFGDVRLEFLTGDSLEYNDFGVNLAIPQANHLGFRYLSETGLEMGQQILDHIQSKVAADIRIQRRLSGVPQL